MKRERNSYEAGFMAEGIACLVLMCKGYRILARRYKTPVGEIDIVARRGKVVAFVEVKFRPDTDQALQSVTPKMRQRIANAARHFIATHTLYQDYDMRFDVMAIVPPFGWLHLDNAWSTTT